MDSPRPAVDLEKELTCSICTEILYQPLTLLDCLHTFCGACLKEWFSWQATAAQNAQSPPPPGSPVFTCPSCRAAVRDTRHNATVVTLLDMLLAAQPDKRKPEEEKLEMDGKYKPGDKVLPSLAFLERTPEQRRLDDEDRRLIAEVREMSLRSATSSPPRSHSPSRRRREGNRSRDPGRGERSRSRQPTRSHDGRTTDHGDRSQRTEDETRRRAEQSVMLQPESGPSEQRRGHRTSRSRQHSTESSDARQRHVEHQSSLRSLIGSDTGSLDIDKEIEDFARQIQEEGLLDGLDLENVDLTNDDELSRRITEAYRRRHRERSRHEAARRSNASAASRASDAGPAEFTPATGDAMRAASRQRARSHSNSRSSSMTRHSEDRSRPPISNTTRLEVRDEATRQHRRRTTSEGRSATIPVVPTQPPAHVSTRSQTDLTQRQGSRDSSAPPPSAERPSITDGRSSSSPVVSTAAQMEPSMRMQLNNARVPAVGSLNSPPPTMLATFEGHVRRINRPPDLALSPRANFAPTGIGFDEPGSPPVTSPGHQRRTSQFFKEPSITCSRCQKEHIEYDLHYNCKVCNNGHWNICLDCYRAGKGCLHWLGFGNAAWEKWETARRVDANVPAPHMLTAGRYQPPKVIPGGAEGRRVLTTENPLHRLQTGTFCVRCFAWTNDCYWRCEICNDADWGFCNDCVNQGRSCTHPLLPLGHRPLQSHTPPDSPRSPGRPLSASMSTSVDAAAIGSFRALTFTTTCDVCHNQISPDQHRYHCYACTSSVVPNSKPGDYDVCQPCYNHLLTNGEISPENGPEGWRRCPQGHRMVIVGFQESRGGQRRYVVHDLIGGRRLKIEPHDLKEPNNWDLQRWYVYFERHRKFERAVTQDVRDSAPQAVGTGAQRSFPPGGGLGPSAVAKWSWYPGVGADDELLFPKGAEVREIENVNGEWYHGVYMGAKGLFPSGYVKMREDANASMAPAETQSAV